MTEHDHMDRHTGNSDDWLAGTSDDPQVRAMAHELAELDFSSESQVRTTLRRQLLTGDEWSPPQKGFQLMNLLQNKRVMAALALALVITIGVFSLTPAAAFAQDIFASLFRRAESDSFPYQVDPDIEPTPIPDPDDIPQRDTLTLAEAEAEAGFDVLAPTFVPANYALDTIQVASGEDYLSVIQTYFRNDRGNGFTLIQSPLIYAEQLEVGATADIIPVEIGDVTGEYVRGYWKGTAPDEGGEGQFNWDPDGHFQQLRWVDGDMVYWLMTFLGSPSDLTIDDLAAIARSLK